MAAAPAVEDFAVRFDRPYFVREQYRLSGPYLVVDSLSVTRGRDTQRSEHRRLIHPDLGGVRLLAAVRPRASGGGWQSAPRGSPIFSLVTVVTNQS